MKRTPICLAFCLLFSYALYSQLHTVKPAKTKPKSSRFGIGVGLTRSVLYLSRNVKEDNDALGVNFNGVYGITKLLRGSIEYTHYFPIDISPTWYNIRASSIEANLHIIARFQQTRSYFYPMTGISFNRFSGHFTGLNDFQNLRRLYEANTDASTSWVGVNAGIGFETFIRKASLFFEYKMRIGLTEVYRKLNIMDVCISGGLRINIKTRSLYSIFRGTRSRYALDTVDPD